MENNLIDVIGQYNIEAKSIQGYIPTADIKEIYIVVGLKKLLTAKSDIDATKAIIETNRYFQDAVGFEPSHRSFDAEKLKALVKKYAVAAIKQKQMSNDELLAQMKKYEEMVLKQSAEKDKLNLQVLSLISIELATLSQALNNIKFTARTTKNKFKKALDLMMHDSDFKSLSRETQIKILHDFINSDVLDLEYFLKRQLINSQRRSI